MVFEPPISLQTRAIEATTPRPRRRNRGTTTAPWRHERSTITTPASSGPPVSRSWTGCISKVSFAHFGTAETRAEVKS